MSMLEEMRRRPHSMIQMVDLKTESDEMSPDCRNSEVQPQPTQRGRWSVVVVPRHVQQNWMSWQHANESERSKSALVRKKPTRNWSHS